MATDERPHIRQLALRRGLAARSTKTETDTTLRVVKVSLLNFEAQEYTEFSRSLELLKMFLNISEKI